MTAIDVEEDGKEQEADDACDDQRDRNVEPCKINWRGCGIGKDGHRKVQQPDRGYWESTRSYQGPNDNSLPVIGASLEEEPRSDKNDAEKDQSQSNALGDESRVDGKDGR